MSPTDEGLDRELKHDPLRTAPVVSGPPSPERRAQGWQIFATAVGALAIMAVVFYGLNNQRDEGQPTGEQTAAQEQAPAAPPGGGGAPKPQTTGKAVTPSTTGQGSNEAGNNGGGNNQNAVAPPGGNNAQNPQTTGQSPQNTRQPPPAAGQ